MVSNKLHYLHLIIHSSRQPMKTIYSFAAPLLGALVFFNVYASGDQRELIELPAPMQDHMMANMRDHLLALNEILGHLADGNAGEAAQVAEKRLGVSSLDSHGASHMAPFMPEPMRQFGTQMHRFASQFAIAATEAEVEDTAASQRRIYAALRDITTNCNACHSAYKIR